MAPVMPPNSAMHPDAPGLSRPLQGKGRASLRRAGDRGRQAAQETQCPSFSAFGAKEPFQRKTDLRTNTWNRHPGAGQRSAEFLRESTKTNATSPSID
jgi:hypothetical protein